MSSPTRSIGLIGVGPHARRTYLPWIAEWVREGRLRLSCVVDLEEQRAPVAAALAELGLAPDALLFARERAAPRGLDGAVEAGLARLRAEGKLDALVVATDPIAHKGYATWALRHDLDVLLDKPISAPVGAASKAEVAAALRADYAELRALEAASQGRCAVQCQRRAHLGYRWIRDYLAEFVRRWQVPITYLDLYHADGMWVMPGEWDRDHHAYKHGTGKLLHSGYHFVDLASWLLALNPPLHDEALDLTVRSYQPADFLRLFAGRYTDLFGRPGLQRREPESVRSYGEMDLYLLGQLRARGHVRTTLALTLQQCSFSRRSWPSPSPDPYKGAGRVRHERLNLQVGTLLNVQVHSYQSHELRDPAPQEEYGPGHLDHFDVLVFRNCDLVGGPRLEQRAIGREASAAERGHNEDARRRLLEAFLRGEDTGSSLASHARTSALLAAIYDGLDPAGPASLALPWGGLEGGPLA
ncbi:MAG: Gfo/Idh/MocA family oxidoreductase [Planctomycetota bacterium]